MGNVAAPSGGGNKVKLIGTYSNNANTATIDLKSDLPQYNKYTKENFIAVPKTVNVYSVTVNTINRNYSPSISSYANGILTITNAGNSGGTTEGTFTSKITSFDIYLV